MANYRASQPLGASPKFDKPGDGNKKKKKSESTTARNTAKVKKVTAKVAAKEVKTTSKANLKKLRQTEKNKRKSNTLKNKTTRKNTRQQKDRDISGKIGLGLQIAAGITNAASSIVQTRNSSRNSN